MPEAIKTFAKKYKVPIDKAEDKWAEAKDAAEKSYGEPPKNPKTKAEKKKSSRFYGTTMNIFKNKMKKEGMITKFVDFLNENRILDVEEQALVNKYNIDVDTAQGLAYLKDELQNCNTFDEKNDLMEEAIEDLEIEIKYPKIFDDLKRLMKSWFI